MGSTEGTSRLPDTFEYTEARHLGVSDRMLRRLLGQGEVERVTRGLYRRADADPLVDLDLLEIVHRVPRGTLCLVSALSRHGLTDEIPASVDLAVPRGARPARLQTPVTWHHFAKDTFDIGRELLPIGPGERIGIYTAERCIIDAFRLRHREGNELAVIALRTWLRRKGNSPSTLLDIAGHFPQAAAPLRSALGILL